MPTFQASTMSRRRVLASAAIALPWLASTRALAQDAPLKLCQSVHEELRRHGGEPVDTLGPQLVRNESGGTT